MHRSEAFVKEWKKGQFFRLKAQPLSLGQEGFCLCFAVGQKYLIGFNCQHMRILFVPCFDQHSTRLYCHDHKRKRSGQSRKHWLCSTLAWPHMVIIASKFQYTDNSTGFLTLFCWSHVKYAVNDKKEIKNGVLQAVKNLTKYHAVQCHYSSNQNFSV